MQSSFSEAETSSLDSTPCESFQLPQSDTSEYFTTSNLNNTFSIPDVIEQPEKRHNPYITTSVSMCSVSTNVVNENVSKRPSSLPISRQNNG